MDQTKLRKLQALWICTVSQPSIKLVSAAAKVPAVRFARENPKVNNRHVPAHGKTCMVEFRLEDKACGLMRGCLKVTAGPGGSTFSTPHQEAASRSPAFGAVRRDPLVVNQALNLTKPQLESSSSHLTHRRIQGQIHASVPCNTRKSESTKSGRTLLRRAGTSYCCSMQVAR